MTDDEPPIGVDLEAWEPPPPPGGIADAVLARLREPVPVAAREPVRLRARGARRWWIAGGVLAAAAVAGLVAARRVAPARGPADGAGVVVADGARHLALGASSAELDAGAEVQWRRRGDRLVVTQPRGAVMWRIAGADTVVIDAGAMVASVEATGASLRVEVQMKPALESNVHEPRARAARTIGTSAVTAAAVAMITVVVYQGQVDVTNAGQTVRVAPGSTLEVRPPGEASEQLAVGGGPARVAELEARVRALEAQLGDDLDRQLLDPFGTSRRDDRDAAPSPAPAAGRTVPRSDAEAAPPADAACDEVFCVLDNYARACCARFKPPAMPSSLGRDAIVAGMAKVKERLHACADGSWRGTMKVRVKVAPSGKVISVDAMPAAQPAACVTRVLRDAAFDATDEGGSFSYPIAFAAPRGCDADALKARGKLEFQSGDFPAALVTFEAAYACRPDESTAVSVMISACNSGHVGKARKAYATLPPDSQAKLLAICVGKGISAAELRAP